jgi:hypothetical protein
MILAMEYSTHLRVVSVNSPASAFIMAQTSLFLTHSSSSSPAGGDGGGGCTYFGGMVNRK